MEAQGIACPSCSTVNEVGWSFCQQCGGRLPQQAAPAPEDWKTQADFKTTPTPRPSFETVVANAPEPPPPAPPASANDSGGVAPTVVVEAAKPAQPATPAPPIPPIPERAPAPVAAEPPVQQQNPAAQQPVMTEVVQSVSDAVACTQCGQTSNLGNAFCANCGAPLTVPKTVVMSSPYAPAKGKLHLVMEGGQLGEIYELSDETIIGRTSGDISFPHDGFMSGRHARIVRRGAAFVLSDEGSRNGTFVKIKADVELKNGDMILVGKQLFRFEV